jgi:hypothetical protein
MQANTSATNAAVILGEQASYLVALLLVLAMGLRVGFPIHS